MHGEGQKAEISRWVNEHSDSLFAYVVARIRDRELAKDLVQETFLSAWKNMEQFDTNASVKTWLFAILKNKLIDHYRKEAARPMAPWPDTHDPYFDEAEHWHSASFPAPWPGDRSPGVETKEFYGILRACQGKLKSIQNHVFSMKYLDGLNSDEICSQLGLTPANYWVLVHRAKLQLRACLEKNWFLKK